MGEGIELKEIAKEVAKEIEFSITIKFIVLIGLILIAIVGIGTIIYNQYQAYNAGIPLPQSYPIFNYDDMGYVAGTGSMRPCIKDDSVIYYENNFTLKVGDIYVYEKTENISGNMTDKRIIHRLMYIDDDWCFFKGDNNLLMDEKINCSQVVQKAIAIAYN